MNGERKETIERIARLSCLEEESELISQKSIRAEMLSEEVSLPDNNLIKQQIDILEQRQREEESKGQQRRGLKDRIT